MKVLFFLFGFLTLIGAAHPEPMMIDRIVAVIDNEIVLQSDVEKKLQLELMGRGVDVRSVPTAQLDDMYNKVLENEIQRKLLLAKAREDSIEINAERIEDAVRYQIRQFKDQYGVQAYADELKKQGLTEREVREEFRQQFRNQMLEQSMYEMLAQTVTVSPREVKEFQEKYRQGESKHLALSHIFIEPKPSETQKAEILPKAEQVLEEIKNGGDFVALAKDHSQDPGSASLGGDLGFFGRGTMVPEFEEVAFSLKVGEISDLVQSPFGFHIIRTEEIQGDQVRARHILFLLQKDDEAAQKKAMDLYRQIQNGADFAELAREHSDFEITAARSGFYRTMLKTEVPPQYEVVKSLKPGDISLPVKAEGGWNVFKVNDDANALEEIAKQTRLEEIFREKLAETRKKLYVDIRLDQ